VQIQLIERDRAEIGRRREGWDRYVSGIDGLRGRSGIVGEQLQQRPAHKDDRHEDAQNDGGTFRGIIPH